MLTTIIVDDEEDSRITLRNFLTKYCPGVKIMGEADSVENAVRQIEAIRPALVFLDINMPHDNGFGLFGKIADPDFYTIFVTAYDEHALQAIKHQAVDYILKPVSITELIQAVSRAQELHDRKVQSQQMSRLIQAASAPPSGKEKICLPLMDGFIYVPVSGIIRCEAEGSYTIFYFTDREKIMVSYTLGSYEAVLKDHGFIRVHNQHLINLQHIEKYKRGRGGTIFMSDKKEVPVSQRKRDEFLKLIHTGNEHIG